MADDNENAKLSRSEIIGKLETFEFSQDLQRGLNGYFLRIKPCDYVQEIDSPEHNAVVSQQGCT